MKIKEKEKQRHKNPVLEDQQHQEQPAKPSKNQSKSRMGCGSSAAEGPVTAKQLAKAGMTMEDWVAIVSR